MNIRYNVVVDELLDNIIEKKVKKIPRIIVSMEKNYLPDAYPHIYKLGVYTDGVEHPIVCSTVEYQDHYGNAITITTTEELKDYFNTNKVLYKDSLPYMTLDEYRRISKTLSNQSTVNIITSKFLSIVNYIYMTRVNSEHKAVVNDVFGISDHISLSSSECLSCTRFEDVYNHLQMNEIDDNYQLYTEYNIFYLDVMKELSDHNPYSTMIRSSINNYEIIFFSSPTSRRYKLNSGIYLEELKAKEEEDILKGKTDNVYQSHT